MVLHTRDRVTMSACMSHSCRARAQSSRQTWTPSPPSYPRQRQEYQKLAYSLRTSTTTCKSLNIVQAKAQDDRQINTAVQQTEIQGDRHRKESFPHQSITSLIRDKNYNAVFTSVVTSLMKGNIALTLVADEAKSKHSAKKPCLLG